MDERLEKALDVANLMTTYNNQRELLKEKFKEDCLYHKDGHRFFVDRTLINFLSTLLNLGHTSDVIILDDFENPYMIEDVQQMLDEIISVYFESTNDYYSKSIQLKKNRSISKIIGI